MTPSLTDEEIKQYLKRCRYSTDPIELPERDVLAMAEEIKAARTPRSPRAVAEYIFEWLETRNNAELKEALLAQRTGDRRCAIDELELIIRCSGRPPNWAK